MKVKVRRIYKLRFSSCDSQRRDAISNKIEHRGFIYQVKVKNYYFPLTTIPEVFIAIQPQSKSNFDLAVKTRIPLNSEIVHESTGFDIQHIDRCINALFNFLLLKTCDICGNFEGVGVVNDYLLDHKEFFHLKEKKVCKHCLANIQDEYNEKLSKAREELLEEEMKLISKEKVVEESFEPTIEETVDEEQLDLPCEIEDISLTETIGEEKSKSIIKLQGKKRKALIITDEKTGRRKGVVKSIDEDHSVESTMINQEVNSQEIIDEVKEFKYIFIAITKDGEQKASFTSPKKVDDKVLEERISMYKNYYNTDDVKVCEEMTY